MCLAGPIKLAAAVAEARQIAEVAGLYPTVAARGRHQPKAVLCNGKQDGYSIKSQS